MHIAWLLWYSVPGITSAIVFLVLDFWRRTTYGKLPPGPLGWPIVGNLLLLGNKPHESLFHLATKYGPLMSLSLGMKTTVVVSSPAMAKEVLKTHDHLLAGRTVIQSVKYTSHDKSSLTWAQCGSHWRMLRQISNTELFSVKRLESLQHFRRDQVLRTIQQILQEGIKGKSINIEDNMVDATVSLLGNMAFGKDMFVSHSPAFQEFKDSISKMMVNAGAYNLADYFPVLQWLDLQCIGRNTKIYMERVFGILDKFMEDRLAKRSKMMDGNDGPKDLLDVLLDMRGDELTLIDIRGYLTDIFAAGTHSSAKAMEWAMAELICNPEKMKRAQAELDEVVGRNQRVEESHIGRLPYLCAVVKEVFRLHPVAPLLIPHRAASTCEIGEYLIRKDTEVIVNVWAIGRDPAIWNEPSKFVPERFIDSKMSSVDYNGQHFELLPFGAGRRICVGLPLASRIIHLVLASLLHSFDWASPEGVTAEHVDMTVKLRLRSLQKAVSLKAIPTPRLPPDVY
jgi:cytochrome P450